MLTSSVTKKRVILISLILMLSLLWFKRLVLNHSSQEIIAAKTADGHASNDKDKIRAIYEVDLSPLEKSPQWDLSLKRDIFLSFEPNIKRAMTKPLVGSDQKPPLSPLPPPPPTILQEAVKSLRYLGFLEKDKKRIAAILKGSEILLVKEGELLMAKFNVDKVSDDLFLSYPPTGETAKMSLSVKKREEIAFPQAGRFSPANPPPRVAGTPEPKTEESEDNEEEENIKMLEKKVGQPQVPIPKAPLIPQAPIIRGPSRAGPPFMPEGKNIGGK